MNEANIKINGVEYKIKQSFRALMLFEEMTGKSVYQMDQTLNDVIKLFYCIIKANNRNIFNFSFDEFIDTIDDNPDSVELFNDYLLSTVEQPIEKDKPKKKRA